MESVIQFVHTGFVYDIPPLRLSPSYDPLVTIVVALAHVPCGVDVVQELPQGVHICVGGYARFSSELGHTEVTKLTWL